MTMTLDTMLDTLTGEVEGYVHENVGAREGDIWREDPVDFDTFVESPAHLALPPLYPDQRAAVVQLLGEDPKLIFEEPQPAPRLPVDWKPTKSSNLRRVAWWRGELFVEFKDRNVYRYSAVPEKTWRGLRRASSPGQYLSQKVKGVHEHTKLEQRADEITVEGESEFPGRLYQLGVLLWGKGSGKDYLCSIVVTYLVYVLLCLRDPQRYFDFAPGEALDVVNVAYNADQAKGVFFEKLKERVKRWRWLRDNFNVMESGRMLGERHPGRPRVEINDNWISFPRKVRCFSRHAQNESYEGFNVIAWVMDEASAFLSKVQRENAEAIYNTLRSSAASRFGRRWVGFIISYPRHGDDFTMTKHRQAVGNPALGIYPDGPKKTWDVNRRTQKEERVEVRPGFFVPVSLVNDFYEDFEEALARYCCQPPAARDALFRYPERIDTAVSEGRRPLVEWEPDVTRRTVVGADGQDITRAYAAVKLTRLGRLPKGARLFAHGDPGLKHDSFALSLGHGVPATISRLVPASEVLSAKVRAKHGIEAEELVPWDVDVTRVVIDAVIEWMPDPARDMQVDLLNVREVLMKLHKTYRFRGLTFDQWNSAETIQELERRKVPCEDEQWSNPFQLGIYKHARSMIYNDLVTLPDTASVTREDPLQWGLVMELKRVELIEDRKIDHPEGGSKDLADAVVRVIQHVAEDGGSRFSFGTAFGHASQYPQHAPVLPVPGRKTDPRKTPSPKTPTERDHERQRRTARPLGELVPSEGTVDGRKLGYGTIKGR